MKRVASGVALRWMLATLLFLLAQSAQLLAEDSLEVDATFDVTHDGIVDAADWSIMPEDVKRAYAEASLRALGLDPNSKISPHKTRGNRYLEGLRAVYE